MNKLTVYTATIYLVTTGCEDTGIVLYLPGSPDCLGKWFFAFSILSFVASSFFFVSETCFTFSSPDILDIPEVSWADTRTEKTKTRAKHSNTNNFMVGN